MGLAAWGRDGEFGMRNRRFNQSAYRRNIRKALGRPIKAGETTAFADNGDLVIYGPQGTIGRLAGDQVERFIV